MSKAWSPKIWKSNEISRDGVFAEQDHCLDNRAAKEIIDHGSIISNVPI